MTLQQLIQAYRTLPERMARTQGEDAIAIASDINAQVTLRRLERGENADGSPFSDYSPGYSAFRTKKGRQTEHKDYAFTGRLNTSIMPVITAEKLGEVRITIAPRGADNEVKVAGAFSVEKRRGATERGANILAPNEEEIQNASQSYAERRRRRLNAILNA